MSEKKRTVGEMMSIETAASVLPVLLGQLGVIDTSATSAELAHRLAAAYDVIDALKPPPGCSFVVVADVLLPASGEWSAPVRVKATRREDDSRIIDLLFEKVQS